MPPQEYRHLGCGPDVTVSLTLREFASRPVHRCPRCQSDHTERKYGTVFARTTKKS